jgi:hypothetical protein
MRVARRVAPQAAGRRPQAAGRRPQAAGRRPQAAGRRPQEPDPDNRYRLFILNSEVFSLLFAQGVVYLDCR